MDSTEPSHSPLQRRHHGVDRPRKSAIPVLDLRFEQGFLRSIQPYIYQIDRRASALFVDEQRARTTEGTPTVVDRKYIYGIPLQINWKGIIYLAIRDQMLSPFLQGAALTMATLYLLPFVRGLGAHIRKSIISTYQSVFTPFSYQTREGVLRTSRQLKGAVFNGATTNFALAE